MAETIALELELGTGKAVNSLGELESASKKVNKALSNTKGPQTLEKRLDALNKEIAETPVNIRAMNKQIQEYQAIALEAGRTSPVGKAALQQAAAMKDRYIDIQNEVNRLANDGMKLQAALDLGTSVVAGYTAFQSALALAGIENENLQKTLVKLQAATSLLVAVETIRKNLEKESTLVLMAKNVVQKASNTLTVIATAVTKGLGISVNTTSVAFKGLKAAIVSTGIGALAVGIGLLVANFEEIKEAITGISKAQKDRVDGAEKLVNAAEREAEMGELQINNMKLQGATEEEIVKFRMKALQKQLDGQLALITAQEELNASQVEGTKSWNETTQDVIEIYLWFVAWVPRLLAMGFQEVGQTVLSFIDLILDSPLYKFYAETIGGEEMLQAGKNLVEKAQDLFKPSDLIEGFIGDATEYVAGLVFDPEATKEEGEKTLSEARLKAAEMKNEMAGLQLDLNNIEAQGIKDRKAARDKDAEEAQKERDRELERFNKFLLQKEGLENAYLDSLLSKQIQEENAVRDKYNNLIELAKIYGDDTKILEEARASEINAIQHKYDLEELKREQAVEDAKLKMTQDGIGALMNLTSAFAKDNEKSQKRAFEINKKLQIAQALIATFQGANAIFATSAANPASILFPGQPFVMAGLAIANGLANVATISKQQFQTSSAGGGEQQLPNLAQGGGPAPTLQPANTSMLVPQQQSQVFVTETDITSTQNQVAVIQGQATF